LEVNYKKSEDNHLLTIVNRKVPKRKSHDSSKTEGKGIGST